MRKAVILTIVSTLALASCGKNKEKAVDPAEQQAIARGQALFSTHCIECHPRSGRGDYLKRIPATLLTRRSEAELVKWIQGSDKHREMPNFTNLSEQEKHDLASFLLSQVLH